MKFLKSKALVATELSLLSAIKVRIRKWDLRYVKLTTLT
jgi:hypothetical protein